MAEDFKEKYIREGQELVELAKNTLINSDNEYESAIELAGKIKERKKVFSDFIKPIKEAAFNTHKMITTKEKEVVIVFDSAEKILTDSMASWNKIKREEAEKKRLEQERIEQERIDKIQKENPENIEEPIQEILFDKPFNPKTVTSSGASAKVQKEITVELIPNGEIEICKLIAEGKLPVDLVTVNLSKLKSLIKENNFSKIPGVIISEKEIVKISNSRK